MRQIHASVFRLCFALIALLAGGLAVAQTSSYPIRPITLVVPYPAGNVTDVYARKLAQGLSAELGQSVVIDNRPGAAGQIGTKFVASAKPDGYTMLLGASSTMAMQLSLYKRLPYSPVDDFVPVNGLWSSPLVMFVPTNKPYKTLEEFVQYAKAHPDSITYGSAGIGSGAHVAGEMLSGVLGVRMTHVPYKDASSLFADVATGRLDMVFDYLAVMRPYIQKGSILALAVGQGERMKAAPDLPTFKEKGYPVVLSTWCTIMMPTGTPNEIVRKMSAAIQKVEKIPGIVSFERDNDLTSLSAMDPARLGGFIHSESEIYRNVIQKAGISLD